MRYRASLPLTLPHCAICTRYATDNLPFEALMTQLDGMPEEMRPDAIASAVKRLRGMPATVWQQQVEAVKLPVQIDSPGWIWCAPTLSTWPIGRFASTSTIIA